MNRRTPATMPALLVALAAFLLLPAIPAGGSPPPQNAGAVSATQDAIKLIQEDRLQEALETLDRAIDADDEYWEAHYQRGRALGLASRWQESCDALLRATELNPGHGHSHRLASIAATNVEDWDNAWDQAIKAQLAGEDMRQNLLSMYEQSPPPDDFAIRINAATVFVAEVDSSTAAADSELPTNFNPEAPAGAGLRQGRASSLEDSAINQSSLDLSRLQRAMRYALSESPYTAVVLDPGRAQYILSIQLTDISTSRSRSSNVTSGTNSESQPYAASGYFRFIDIEKREVVYRAPIDFENIGSTPAIAGKLRRYVTDLTAWLVKLEGGGN